MSNNKFKKETTYTSGESNNIVIFDNSSNTTKTSNKNIHPIYYKNLNNRFWIIKTTINKLINKFYFWID